MEGNLFDRERLRLSKALNKAALDLLQHVDGVVVQQIPHTDPPLFVLAGTAEAIRRSTNTLPHNTDPDCLDAPKVRAPRRRQR